MLEINGINFDVIIERKRIRNIYLRVHGNLINATCPYYVPNYEVYNFINSKKQWIYKCYVSKSEESKLDINDTIYYKGKKYNLVVMEGKKALRIDEDTIYIRCKGALLDEAIKVFYEYGKKVIKQYALSNQEKYLTVLRDYGYNLVPEYNVKNLKSMWGCCYSQKNYINLSVRLIHFDPICLEAILWHELLHFVIPNHSKRFHDVLDLHMPKYNEIIKSLK